MEAEPHRTPVKARSAALHSGQSAPEPGSCDPALRANAFSEVTRLFCRLPLPTLFYRLEASSLGDRMRLFGTDGK